MIRSNHRKGFAVFMSFIIVLSMGLIPPPAASYAEEPESQREVTIVNPGFEDSLPGDEIVGWTYEGEGGTISVTDAVYHNGSHSLHFHDQNDDSLTVMSNRFPVSPNMEYTANAFMHVIDQTHSVVFEMRFYDEAGRLISEEPQNTLYRSQDKELWLHQWFEIQVEAIAPEDAVTASIVFHSGGVSLTEAYFDDVTVIENRKEETEQEIEDVELTNPDFEAPVVDDVIPGWTPAGEGGTLEVSTEEVASGAQSLYFEDGSNTSAYSAVSDPITVETGYMYQVDAQMFALSQSHSIVFEMRFYDENETEVQVVNTLYAPADSDTWLNQWFDIQVEAAIPANAVSMRVAFHSGVPSLTQAYFDNVTITRYELGAGGPDEVYDDFINPDFEMTPVQVGEIPGWTFGDGITLSTEQALSGDYSMKLHDTSTSAAVRAYSNRIAVEPNLFYNIQAHMYVISQTHNIVFEVAFFTENGAEINRQNVLYGDVNKERWEDMSLGVEAPANASYMEVSFGSGGISLTEAYFDDLSISVVERTKENPSAMSDEEFFGVWDEQSQSWSQEGKINYAYSGDLSQVEQAAKDGDYTLAAEALLTYYQTREGFHTLEDFSDSRDSDLTELVMDRIFTLAGEAYVTTVTVGDTDETVESDVTEEVVNELDELRDHISFILMARHKGQSEARFYSREHEEHSPRLEVVAGGETLVLTPSKDTYIDAQRLEENFGSSEALYVYDDQAPEDLTSKKSYLNFDISQINAPVESAQLFLHGSNQSGTGDFDVMVYTTRDTGWVEHELNWSNHWGKTFSWQGIEGGTDWLRPPHSDNEYYYQIPRFYYANQMIAEYLATDDERYTDDLMALILDYIYDAEGYGGEQGAGSHPRTLDSAIRAVSWINAYHVLRETDTLDAVANANILKTLWKTARFLENNLSGSNWGVIESKGFYHIASYFPEFQQAPDWEELINTRLELLFAENYMRDGGYIEASTTYASIAINEYINIKKFGTINNRTFSDDFNMWLQRAGKYLIDIAFPNGVDPMMGDSSSNNHRRVLTELANETGDDYLAYVGSGGEVGIAPPYTSTLYPVHRTGIMRTGWDEDDLYLHINSGYGAHAHPDELSVIVYGYGRPLLVDPGAFSYSHDDISNWLRRTTQAHNTIEINGTPQDGSRGGTMDVLVTNPQFDFLTGETFGTPGFVHERNILFVKPGFWIVSDQVTGGEGSNSYEQNWHFLPQANLALEEGSKKSYTSFESGANMQVIPADPQEVDAYLADGYYSESFYTVADAKYASYMKEVEGDVTFDTVLYPNEADDGTQVTVERVELEVDRNTATALRINQMNGATTKSGYYYMTYEDEALGSRTIGDFVFDGKALYAEETTAGELSEAIVVQGSKLEYNGNVIADFAQTVEDLSLEWNSDVLSVHGRDLRADSDANSAAPIYAPGVDRVKLNGEEIPFTRDGDYVYAVGLVAPLYANETNAIPLNLKTDESSIITFDLIPAVNETEGWITVQADRHCAVECATLGIHLNEDGLFQFLDGTEENAAVREAYLANQMASVKIEVDPLNGTYDVYVTPAGGFETQLTNGYALNGDYDDSAEWMLQLQSTENRDFRIQNLLVNEEEMTEPDWIRNSDFEEELHEDGSVPGWSTISKGPNSILTRSDEVAYNGTYSLYFFDNDVRSDNDDILRIGSDLITVRGGYEYELDIQAYILQQTHQLRLEMEFYDRDGDTLLNVDSREGASALPREEWVNWAFHAEAPEDAVTMQIFIHSGNIARTEVYFDALRLQEIEPEVDPGKPEEPIEGSMQVSGQVVLPETHHLSDLSGFAVSMMMEDEMVAQSTTDSEGQFIIAFDGDAGTYSLVIEREGYLATSGTFEFAEGSSDIGTITKYVGDFNGDDRINIEDIALVAQAFQQEKSEGNAIYDVDQNGVIDLQDVVTIARNFGKAADDIQAPLEPVRFANGGFEEAPDEEGNIPGWTVTETHSDSTVARSDAQANSGNYSLFFHDNSESAGLRVESEPLAVKSGESYTISAEAYMIHQSASLVVDLEYIDANNQGTLVPNLFRNLPREQWETLSVDFTAPNNTEEVRVIFYSGAPSITEVYLDDVVIIQH